MDGWKAVQGEEEEEEVRAKRAEQIRELAYWLAAACSPHFFLNQKQEVLPFVLQGEKQRHRTRRSYREDGSMIVEERNRQEEGPYLHFTSPTPNSLSR